MNNRIVKSLYIHIPFCHSICGYCDFCKLLYNEEFAKKYIDALLKEIDSYQIKDLQTIYVGGGTPTSLSDGLFSLLFNRLKELAKGVKEFTVEANPKSLTNNKIDIMLRSGVNRLSIGVESTDDQILKAIGRKHNYADVIKAVELAKSKGLDNINLDLIIGLPHVDKKRFINDLNNILLLKPKHISIYSLTVHEHTLFGINKVKEPEEEFARELYDEAEKILKSKQFEHYEVSNWCQKNYDSKHNLTYWKNEQYYGCGLGASGYVNNIRYTNTKSLNKYLEGSIVDYQEKVNQNDKFEYDIMLNLRTKYGLDLKKIKEEYDIDLLDDKAEIINHYINSGHLYIDEYKLIATYEGMMILDKIVLDIIS